MMQYLYLLGGVHLFICPFTKVEESFNLQAMHDIIYHKWNFTEFDHLEFPGVVPRTFLGPLIITLLLSPVLTIIDLFGLISSHKFVCQYLVRAALGCCVLFSYQKLYKTVKETFGNGVATWFLAITMSQYHFIFYLSRPLPNIMALPLVLLAVSSWIKKDHFGLICFSAAAVVIFRFELAIFLGTIILIEIMKGNITFLRVMKIGIGSSICALILTVVVDSIFWNRIVWPEGEVFWFNVVLNKSSNWGVSPFLWYWYSALPRALGTTLALAPFGERNAKLLLVPSLLFIVVMSFLPHKELRFIIYTFPFFNISAATACNRMWMNRHKSMGYWLTSIHIILHLVANFILSCALLKIASENYPGGHAITRLHKIVPADVDAHVYIDNLSAQTGVSRFTQANSNWIYNKTENLPTGGDDFYTFSHLLLEAKSKYSPNLKPFLNSHEILDVIEGFSHIHFNYNSFPPIKIKCKPMIFILKRNHIPKFLKKIGRHTNISLPAKSILDPNIKKTINVQLSDVKENENSQETVVNIDKIQVNANVEIAAREDVIPRALKTPQEMNVDDFFGDLGEKLIELGKKKKSANKVLKVGATKEKTINEL